MQKKEIQEIRVCVLFMRDIATILKKKIKLLHTQHWSKTIECRNCSLPNANSRARHSRTSIENRFVSYFKQYITKSKKLYNFRILFSFLFSRICLFSLGYYYESNHFGSVRAYTYTNTIASHLKQARLNLKNLKRKINKFTLLDSCIHEICVYTRKKYERKN